MKIFLTKALLLFISILLTACVSSKPSSEIVSCPKNTKSKPVTFIVIALDKKGLPYKALVPIRPLKKLDLSDAKLELTTIAERSKNQLLRDHKVKRKTQICFVSAEVTTRNKSGYKFSPKKIAVLWRPEQKIKFKSNIVIENVPKNSPLDIAYKFTLASANSNPENGKTYLDPRIVIRR